MPNPSGRYLRYSISAKLKPLETLLKEVVHVLAAVFTVRYYIHTGVHLIGYGSANKFVGLFPGQRLLP
jgi:hypothetical protein